jgi:hypothetical protein
MNVQNETKKTKYRWDIIVIAAILLLSLALLLIHVLGKEEGSVAVVRVNDTVVGTYPLAKDGTFVLNGGTNVLVIEDGTARLIESQCPDHTCELTGRVKYVGQTIVCLPNHLSVTISGNTANGVDFVS